MSRKRHSSPFRRYSLSPERNRRRVTLISPPGNCRFFGEAFSPWFSASDTGCGSPCRAVSRIPITLSNSSAQLPGASSLSARVMLTSAMPVGGRVPVPLKITSAILCSPSTQLTASARLDFPHPLGPSMAAVLPSQVKRVRSAKDLKPSNSISLSFSNFVPPEYPAPSEQGRMIVIQRLLTDQLAGCDGRFGWERNCLRSLAKRGRATALLQLCWSGSGHPCWRTAPPFMRGSLATHAE